MNGIEPNRSIAQYVTMPKKIKPRKATAPPQISNPSDMVRLSKSKAGLDVSPNTLREYHRRGLRFYRIGKAVWISRSELDLFIRMHAAVAA